MALPPLVASGDLITAAHINALRNYLPLMADGSAATPGVRFEDDPDTGLHRSANNELSVVAGGTIRFRVSASQITFAVPVSFGGQDLSSVDAISANSVQAGAFSAVHPFGEMRFMQDSLLGFRWALANNGTLGLLRTTDNFSTQTVAIFASASGAIGIGTAIPAGLLDVAGSFYTGTGQVWIRPQSPGSSEGGHLTLLGHNGSTGAWNVDVFNDHFRIFGDPGVALQINPNADVAIGYQWNAGHLVMGPFHIWVQSTGTLRIKNGVPTSETDGVAVGIQA